MHRYEAPRIELHGSEYRARGTEITPKKVQWTESRVRNYAATCGLCPVEEHCTLSIPSAENYNQGKVTIRGPRPYPHEEQGKLLNVPKRVVPRGSKLPLSNEGEDQDLENQVTLFD